MFESPRMTRLIECYEKNHALYEVDSFGKIEAVFDMDNKFALFEHSGELFVATQFRYPSALRLKEDFESEECEWIFETAHHWQSLAGKHVPDFVREFILTNQ